MVGQAETGALCFLRLTNDLTDNKSIIINNIAVIGFSLFWGKVDEVSYSLSLELIPYFSLSKGEFLGGGRGEGLIRLLKNYIRAIRSSTFTS